jgi:type II secretory pathway component PulL
MSTFTGNGYTLFVGFWEAGLCETRATVLWAPVALPSALELCASGHTLVQSAHISRHTTRYGTV